MNLNNTRLHLCKDKNKKPARPKEEHMYKKIIIQVEWGIKIIQEERFVGSRVSGGGRVAGERGG
jgi:hypothetical protein